MNEFKKHKESALHLENACKFKIFGIVNIAAQIDSAHKISKHKHNELVTKYKTPIKQSESVYNIL